jgi:arylsulfatase A-like enzyme
MSAKNIILIALDGFRRDKVDLCPSLNALKERSFFFSKMKTAAPYTIASLHSIFSGMYPSRNGVDGYYKMFRFKKDEITTLAQLLKENNYYTVSDTLHEAALPSQGFDECNIFDEYTVDLKKRHTELIKRLSKKERFFAFLHFTDTHAHYVREIIQKYEKSENNDEYYKLKKENDEKYNANLPLCDEYVSTIIKALQDTDLFEKTILIFISDHGTSVGEKYGEKFYGVFVYENTINVFCIMLVPGKSPQVISKQCSTIDLYPTIAELAGIQIENKSKIQGESLLRLIDNPSAKDREVFVETGGLYGPWPSLEKHNVFCVVRNNKKLIYNDTPQTWEFYDLIQDPCELKNIYQEDSDEILNYKKRLFHYFKENGITTKLNENV